jgi:Family of unknown function (DUF5719)
MRSRSQVLFALVVAATVALGGAFLDRSVGVKTEPAPARVAVASGAWFCPHGGGQEDWRVTLEVANPGARPSIVRVTSFGEQRPAPSRTYTVGPGTTIAVPASASGRGASSMVEYFGSWVAVGWVAQAGGGESGVAAEPCADRTGERWFAPDGDTTQGQDAYLVVMNPFSSRAVFDVVLYTRDQPPNRSSALTDVLLAPRRSVAIRLNDQALDETAVGSEVDVKRGRVAVASLGVGAVGGIRSAIGSTEAAASPTFLTAASPGDQSTVVVLNPSEAQTRFDATLLNPAEPAPAGSLTDQAQGGQSAVGYPVTATGASSVEVTTTGAPAITARRVAGPTTDSGATGGYPAAAPSWVVLPTVACVPNVPGLVLVNAGGTDATVTLHALPDGEGPSPRDETIAVPATRAIEAPPSFLSVDPTAAVLVTSSGGPILASGASSSCGQKGIAGFAVASGIPVPGRAGP